MPSNDDAVVAQGAGRRRSPRVSAKLRAVAAATAVPGFVEAPAPTGNNPSARRVRRLARKGLLLGWPFRRS